MAPDPAVNPRRDRQRMSNRLRQIDIESQAMTVDSPIHDVALDSHIRERGATPPTALRSRNR
jgi:hypothetical protein